MTMLRDRYDILVIGGGFYGCIVALELSQNNKRVALLEKEADLMQRASYVNQARIHQGYHYPRSILTALRSRVNFDRFVEEFKECVYADFQQYYAIGKVSSKVNADQFRLFCERTGAPLRSASKEIKAMFDPSLVEDVFLAREYAFDALKLKKIMLRALEQEGVDVAVNCRARCVSESIKDLKVEYEEPGGAGELKSGYVFNCTYSEINQIMGTSKLPLVPLKHEFTEMALVEMPNHLRNMGFTIMDGPFFSIMPFPARHLHSLSHVRYTPHHCWQDRTGERYMDAHEYFREAKAESYHVHMLKDAQRYMPALRDCRYVESLWEVKTVLPQSEVDDSRPILFRRSEKFPNLISILGGKIDNVFDIREKLKVLITTELSVQ
jgi:glycine/D-amino acid oxidase-like deaminating enzyme